MRRLRIWHLLFCTAVAASIFAFARVTDLVTAQLLLFFAAIGSPLICFVIAEAVAPANRPIRLWIRRSLLLTALLGISGMTALTTDVNHLAMILVAVAVCWAPQLAILSRCSEYRSVLSTTRNSTLP